MIEQLVLEIGDTELRAEDAGESVILTITNYEARQVPLR